MSNEDIIKLGDGEKALEVKVRRSLKAKYISIRISRTKEIELVIPVKGNITRAHKFLLNKEHLIRNRLHKIKDTSQESEIPTKLPIFGYMHEVIIHNNKDIEVIKIEKDSILISSVLEKSDINLMLKTFLKMLLEREIEKYADKVCKILKVKYKKITLREVTTRWGSCSSNGNLSFSWRLIFAPKFVIEYLVSHELSHLVEMNHSDGFWKLVDKVCPDNVLASVWLKKNSTTLHSYFKD
jgi:predicted metal-dependent hydrolase